MLALEAASHLQALVERRPNPALLVAPQPQGSTTPAISGPPPARGLECNRFLKAARVAKGRTLTLAEVAQARRDFKAIWENMGDRGVFDEAYEEWRHTRAALSDAGIAPPYKLIWGGGCRSTPFTREEIADCLQASGWPSDEQVRRVTRRFGLPRFRSCVFLKRSRGPPSAMAHVRLDARRHEVSRSELPLALVAISHWECTCPMNPSALEFRLSVNLEHAHKAPAARQVSEIFTNHSCGVGGPPGLFSRSRTKTTWPASPRLTTRRRSTAMAATRCGGRCARRGVEADSAQTLVMFEGCPVSGPGGIRRVAALLTGTSYNPKVSDLTICNFATEVEACSDDLALPFDVTMGLRGCKVSDRFQCIGTKTSSEFAALLCATFGRVELYKLAYHIPVALDGSLSHSRVTAKQNLGVFWTEDQKKPWGARGAASSTDRLDRSAALLRHMAASDPFAPAPSAPPRARSGTKRATPGADGNKSMSRASGSLPSAAAHGAMGDDPSRNLPADGAGGLFGEGPPADQEALGEAELDLADNEEDELEDDDLLELRDTYGHGAAGHPMPAAIVEDVVDRASEDLAPEHANQETLEQLAEQLGEVVANDDEGLVAPTGSASSGGAGSGESSLPAVEPPPPVAPWEAATGPSAAGYVYHEGRSVMRIQRGKPKGRLTLTCYRHRKCSLLINLERPPSDEELKRWLFEMEPAPPGASAEESKALADRHRIGKGSVD